MFLIREDTFDVKVLLTLLVKKSILKCPKKWLDDHMVPFGLVIVRVTARSNMRMTHLKG